MNQRLCVCQSNHSHQQQLIEAQRSLECEELAAVYNQSFLFVSRVSDEFLQGRDHQNAVWRQARLPNRVTHRLCRHVFDVHQ